LLIGKADLIRHWICICAQHQSAQDIFRQQSRMSLLISLDVGLCNRSKFISNNNTNNNTQFATHHMSS
jgi:hypothetical protein